MSVTTLLRVWFFTIFCLALWVVIATNIISSDRVAPDIGDQIASRLRQVIQTSGGVIEPIAGKKMRMLENVIQFRVPGCENPLVVVPQRIGISAESIVRVVVKESDQNYGVYTVYLDETIAGYGFLWFQLRSLKIQIEQVFGATDHRFALDALTVLVPENCPNAKVPQWIGFWRDEIPL